MTAIVATLGFDERHIVRSILRIGFGGVKRVILLVPTGGIDERTQRAFDEVKKLASMAGVNDVSLMEVPIESFNDAVADIRRVVYDCVQKYGRAVVSLGGGMRALVVETLIAVFTLPPNEKKKVDIVVDLETGKDGIKFPAWIPLELRLSDVESRVLEYVVEKGSANLGDVATELGVARSTAWKALERLVDAGLLSKREYTYEPTEVGRFVYALITKGIPRESAS
ncbi:MAG: CRISPR locus-related DNA-binding protein [Crenarchaeota archaeon]|nr:CRISPR locus-related DNA-binding protein [Thermoproteota archaeon]